MSFSHRPSLRQHLQALAPGNQVVAYLTIGDPPGQFLEVADELIAAGACALELGFPDAQPQEGAVLLASHRRALDAGVNLDGALELLAAVAQRHPATPLVAVVQWPAIKSDDVLESFLDRLCAAGSAAILPVGVPLWQLPALAAKAELRKLEIVFACPPSASRIFRAIAFRYCTGAIYVPRSLVTGDSGQLAEYVEFCEQVSRETDAPILVGVGVRSAADVTEICRTPAKAAAVGSALVDYVIRGGSAGEFVRRMLMRSEPNA